MIRFFLGLLLGAVFAYSGAEDACDARLKALFTPDNYPAMHLERRDMEPRSYPVPMRKQ